jgi:mono/diheme cytochrome c family protein
MRYLRILTLLLCLSSAVQAETPAPLPDLSVWDGVYTEAQAQRGKAVFQRSCSNCHADQIGAAGGHGPAPSLMGEDFAFRWLEASLLELLDTLRQTMPEAAPNSLGAEEYGDVLAYMLELNAYPSGAQELDYSQRETLARTYIEESKAD